jgi:hypothetical protein
MAPTLICPQWLYLMFLRGQFQKLTFSVSSSQNRLDSSDILGGFRRSRVYPSVSTSATLMQTGLPAALNLKLPFSPSCTSLTCSPPPWRLLTALLGTASVTSSSCVIRGGKKVAQSEFEFVFANIRRNRILQMSVKFAKFELEFESKIQIRLNRIRIESKPCSQIRRISWNFEFVYATNITISFQYPV